MLTFDRTVLYLRNVASEGAAALYGNVSVHLVPGFISCPAEHQRVSQHYNFDAQ
jgi:hypothetical protein